MPDVFPRIVLFPEDSTEPPEKVMPEPLFVIVALLRRVTDVPEPATSP